MRINEVIDALVSIFKFKFSILEALGNLPNVIFIIVGILGITYWLLELKKYSKEPNN